MMKHILKVEDVSSHLDSFVVLDARFRLQDPAAAPALFVEEHIPGAQFLSLEKDLSGAKTSSNGRHPLPSRAQLMELFSKLGISADQPVLVYDDADMAGAARAWFCLRLMGHENVHVLDGGLGAWKRAGFATERGPGQPRRLANFPDRPGLVTAYSLPSLPKENLWDARAPERFRGDVEPLDKQAGHIPGAKNLFYKTLLKEDGSLRSELELRALIPQTDKKGLAPIFYCGSGVTAALLYFVAESLGMESAIYPGSWSEYSAHPEMPIAKGEA